MCQTTATFDPSKELTNLNLYSLVGYKVTSSSVSIGSHTEEKSVPYKAIGEEQQYRIVLLTDGTHTAFIVPGH